MEAILWLVLDSLVGSMTITMVSLKVIGPLEPSGQVALLLRLRYH
jgi:hypothetical protein